MNSNNGFRRLLIRNFQKHKKQKIDLDQITTIIGSSDSGKSAIVRALRWLCLNDLRGSAFIREGAKKCSAALDVDQKIVKRSKGKENSYSVDKVSYKAVSTQVPEDVAELLNLSDLNFQNQHDAPLWFSESPGQVSKQLNAVVDLDQIDKTLASINQICRSAKAEVDRQEDRHHQAAEEVTRLKWIRRAQGEWKAISAKLSDIKQKGSDFASLERLILQVKDIDQELGIAGGAKSGLQNLLETCQTRVERRIEQRTALTEEKHGLGDLIQQIKEDQERICQLKELESEVAQDLAKVKLCPLCGHSLKTQ